MPHIVTEVDITKLSPQSAAIARAGDGCVESVTNTYAFVEVTTTYQRAIDRTLVGVTVTAQDV